MNMNKSALAASVAALILAGCASTSSVKSIQGDRETYLRDHFKREVMSPEVLKALVAPTATRHYARIETEMDGVTHDTTANGERRHHVARVATQDQDGTWRAITHLSRNDVEYMQRFSLGYMGLFMVRWQEVVLDRNLPSHILEIKKLRRLDAGLADPQPGGEYVFDEETGPDFQLMNYVHGKYVCKAQGQDFPAAQLLASLQGSAIKLACSYYADGQDVATSVLDVTFLREYSYFIEEGYRSGYSSTTFKLTQFKAS